MLPDLSNLDLTEPRFLPLPTCNHSGRWFTLASIFLGGWKGVRKQTANQRIAYYIFTFQILRRTIKMLSRMNAFRGRIRSPSPPELTDQHFSHISFSQFRRQQSITMCKNSNLLTTMASKSHTATHSQATVHTNVHR